MVRLAIVVCLLLTGAISAWHIANSSYQKKQKNGLEKSDRTARSFEEMGGRHYRDAVLQYNKLTPADIQKIDAIYDSAIAVEKNITG